MGKERGSQQRSGVRKTVNFVARRKSTKQEEGLALYQKEHDFFYRQRNQMQGGWNSPARERKGGKNPSTKGDGFQRRLLRNLLRRVRTDFRKYRAHRESKWEKGRGLAERMRSDDRGENQGGVR